MRRFDLVLPSSLPDCLAALGADGGGDVKLVAGGTDLLPQMKNGLLAPARVVDLSGVSELKVLARENGTLRVGAGVSARAIEVAPAVREGFQALAEGAGVIGSLQVRNLATLGGNICNAAPSADVAPALLALDAVAVVEGPEGRRLLPIADFFQGVRRTALQPGELLVEVQVPAPAAGSGGTYVRHTPRRELDIAVVGVASQLTIQDGRCTKARIALGAVAPTPVRATEAEAKLEGEALTPALIDEAARLAVQSARPISDQRGSAEYRRHLVRVLTRRTLQTAFERATGRSTSRNGAH